MATSKEQGLQLTISRAILDAPDLNRILGVILSGITSPDGLNFNRAFLFLADERGRELRPYSAMGLTGDAGEAEQNLSDRMAGFVVPLSASAPAIDEGDENVPMQALVAKCAALGKPYFSNSISAFYQPPPASGDEVLRLTRVASVPLCVKGSVLGVILADNALSGRAIRPEELEELETVGNLAAIAIEIARLNWRLDEMALRDGLTGVYNRRQYEARLEKEVDVAVKARRALALVVFHLRNFSQCNRTHGRQCGDRVLKDLADFLRKRVRTEDLIARYGEEEFVVMLTGGATREEAFKVAEKLRAQLTEQELGGLTAGEIQVSGGLAWLPSGKLDSTRISAMLDAVLGQARRAEHDQMILADED